MHLHETLRRCLLDPDRLLYRVDLAHAIAALQAIDLKPGTLWIDPSLPPQLLAQARFLRQQIQRRKLCFARLCSLLGQGALVFLLLNLILGFFPRL